VSDYDVIVIGTGVAGGSIEPAARARCHSSRKGYCSDRCRDSQQKARSRQRKRQAGK
jgi:hypothetical protein